jgi:hypothetical protein
MAITLDDVVAEARKTGALLERIRIIQALEAAKKGLTFGDDRALVDNMIRLIEAGTE